MPKSFICKRVVRLAPILLFFLAIAPAHAYDWTRTMARGMSGDDIRELQIRIAGWAADCPTQTFIAIDGQFGPATEAALKRFQYAYRIPVDGIAGPTTHTVLNWLEAADGSTRHFNFTEFHSRDGAGFTGGNAPEADVRENVRRLMYKMEALRRKMGDRSVRITSGFRSISHNAAVGGAANSQHTYGIAADYQISPYNSTQLYEMAQTCGFSGVIWYTGHNHVDSRREYSYGATAWFWSNGTLPLEGCFRSPPRIVDVQNLLRGSGGLEDGRDYFRFWDMGPMPSANGRGYGNEVLDLTDAVRAIRRRADLETRWP